MPPQLHVVYCLTSTAGDIFEAMTRVSLATLRFTNPSARVTIACDQQTYQSLQSSGSQLFHEASAVLGFPTPDGTATYRSRFLKSQLGRLIEGPFLFLDSDTVVREPLTALLDLKCDIAAAPNHSRDTIAEQIWAEDRDNLEAMGWKPNAAYVNSGVIWYSGSAASRRFADSWHKNWLENVEVTGRFRDQPSINYTLCTMPSLMFHLLGHRWNAQVHHTPSVSHGSPIWHLYSSPGKNQRDLFKLCYQSLSFARPLKPNAAMVKRLTRMSDPEVSRLSPMLLKRRLMDKFQRTFPHAHLIRVNAYS